MGTLPDVNGVSGGWSNPYDSAYFGYLTGQAEFNAAQYAAYQLQQNPAMFASIIAAEEAAATQAAAAQQAQKNDTGATTTATALETDQSATSNRDFDPPISAVEITLVIVGIIVPAADLVNAGISAYNGDCWGRS